VIALAGEVLVEQPVEHGAVAIGARAAASAAQMIDDELARLGAHELAERDAKAALARLERSAGEELLIGAPQDPLGGKAAHARRIRQRRDILGEAVVEKRRAPPERGRGGAWGPGAPAPVW